MRRESSAERAAWTAHIEGHAAEPVKHSKYGNKRVEFNGHTYDSIREANVAAKLQMLERGGKIRSLREQHPIVLVPGDGKLRAIKYIADFTYIENEHNRFVVMDAKGYKTQIYRLKKRLCALLLGIKIEEV